MIPKNFILVTALLVSLVACGKVDVGMTVDQSKEKSITANEGVSITSKVNVDDRMDLSKTQSLGVIQTQAWQNFLRYATGASSVLQMPVNLEKVALRGGFDSRMIMFEKLAINPVIVGKGGVPQINPSFFAGADNEPFLPWQSSITDDLKAARDDLTVWVSNGAKGLYPESVLLWQIRYNAVLNILYSFQTGGNFNSAGSGSFALSKNEKTEIWDGVIATEYSNLILKDVLARATARKNKDFMRLRENLILQFLSIKKGDFENFKYEVSFFLQSVDKSQAILLNTDKGLQIGSLVYLNEAGKTTGWQKIDGGAIIYSSNVIDGVEYKLVISSTKGISTDMNSDMKRSSDLRESVGNKTNIGASLSSPQGSPD